MGGAEYEKDNLMIEGGSVRRTEGSEGGSGRRQVAEGRCVIEGVMDGGAMIWEGGRAQ